MIEVQGISKSYGTVKAVDNGWMQAATAGERARCRAVLDEMIESSGQDVARDTPANPPRTLAAPDAHDRAGDGKGSAYQGTGHR